ncbi:MAG: hypothetical protein L6302_03015 [Desulfobacteraceae bacterium]|nr:hypothetical protein [Desulfobacteraceae bacterium]
MDNVLDNLDKKRYLFGSLKGRFLGATRLPSDGLSRFFTIPPLPLANTFANVFSSLTGFTDRGLSPHLSACEHLQADKFTPMPGVHKANSLEQAKASLRSVLPAGFGGYKDGKNF